MQINLTERSGRFKTTKLTKLKPGKREILISSLIFGAVGIVILFSSFSTVTLGPAATTGTIFQKGAVPGLSGSAQNLFGYNVAETSTTSANNRVVNTSEALVGELKHGDFQPATSQIISNLTLIGGYIVSSNLMYNGTTWVGLYSVNVPSASAQPFLFQVTTIVDHFGKTTSVNIETQDVTNQTGGNQSKVPYSMFAIALQEEANSTTTHPTSQFSGILGNIGSILGVVLDGAAYVVLIALPVYLLVLGGVLLSGRVLYPMFLRVSKSSQAKKTKSVVS